MSQTDQTTGEITDSLTGHEEMWIADQFGKPIGQLVEGFLERSDVGPFYRALIFILKRRDGVNEDDARNAALDMKLSEVMEFFPQTREDAEPDDVGAQADAEAVEESGKDEPEPEPEQTPSLSSVS